MALLLVAPGGTAGGVEDDPLAGAQELLRERRYAEAQARASEAQRVYLLRRDERKEAVARLVLGVAELLAGDSSAAAADLEKAAAMLEASGDRYSSWMALWHLGILERAQKKSEQALSRHSRGLALLREVEGSSQPFSAEGLTYLGRWLDMPEQVLEWLSTRPEIAKPVLLAIAEVMSRKGAADALKDLGRLQAAEAELAQAGDLSRWLGGLFDSEIAIQLGDLRRRQWRLDEARDVFREALDGSFPPLSVEKRIQVLAYLVEIEIASGRPESSLAWCDQAAALARLSAQRAEVLLLQAHVLEELDRLEAAEGALAEGMALAREAGQIPLQARIEHKLGLVAMRADHHGKAAAHFESAIRLFQDADLPDEEGQTWRLLFQVYSHFQSRDSARAALEKARELAARSGARSPKAMTEALDALERGDVTEMEKRLAAVLELPEAREVKRGEDLEILRRTVSDFSRVAHAGDLATVSCDAPGGNAGMPSLTSVIRLVCGFVHYRRGELAAARALCLEALKESPRKEIEVYSLMLIGLSYEREGRINKAIPCFKRAVEAVEQSVEDVRVEELLAGYMADAKRQDLYAKLVDLLVRKGRIARAFSYAERARSRAFLQGLGNRRVRPDDRAGARLAQEAETLRSQLLDGEREDLESARQQYQSLLVRLKVSNPEYASLTKVEPLRVQSVRDELPPATTLISYFVSPSRVHAWVLDEETLRHVGLPLSPLDLRRAVCWADEIGRRSHGRGARALESGCEAVSAEELHQKLFAPLARHIRHRRLVLVPHGELHYLPFAALRNPETGRYLVEDYTLTYAPSASALLFLRAKETPVEGRSLVLGEPEGSIQKLDPLPAAKREAAAVARLLGTAAILGPQARESLFYELGGQVDLLHVAAHGIYEPARPLFSRIALAPGEGRDGNLEVHEVLAELDLSGVNLVVLSACRTAAGERSRGDEIVGLTRAFLYAGSPGVISTLWDIDDDASAVLMEELYRRLLAGASAADALREAQLALLRDPLRRDPYFWAAFNLTGYPQGRWGEVTAPASAGTTSPAD